MNEFKTYHPIVNLIYFVSVIGFSCYFMHPLCLFLSVACSFSYSAMLKGAGAVKTKLIYIIPILIMTPILNAAFNHEGATIIAYLPDGNPLTIESIAYGIASAVMIVAVICWFSCYNEIMTSDKFIYLFGKVIPSMSLIISMTLRFVPRFSAQLKNVANARRCMGQDVSRGGFVKRAKCGLTILSAVITWSLENAVETADSMKSRAYGIKGRTAFSIFVFDKRDKRALFSILALAVYILSGSISGQFYFSYYPSLKSFVPSAFGISVFFAYFFLCAFPIIIEFWKVRKWKALKSKI